MVVNMCVRETATILSILIIRLVRFSSRVRFSEPKLTKRLKRLHCCHLVREFVFQCLKVKKRKRFFFFSPQLLFEVVCEPCPIIVSRMCVGSHKSFDKVCSSDPIFHCDGLCVGPLLCGNHFCEKGCHANKGPETCRQCERNCGHVLDCGHACPLKCHPKSTPHPICMVPIEFTCYCTLTTFELPCCDSKNANLVEEKKHCK